MGRQISFNPTYVGDNGETCGVESFTVDETFVFQAGVSVEACLRAGIESELGERQAVLQDLLRELVASNFVRVDGAGGRAALEQLDGKYPARGTLPHFERLSGVYNAAGAILHNARGGKGAGYARLPAILDGLLKAGALKSIRCAAPPVSAQTARDDTAPREQLRAPASPAVAAYVARRAEAASAPAPTPAQPPRSDFSMMQQPEPQSKSFSVLMNELETGAIKVPQFQRDFVWTREKSAKLLDSIIKGYPIGTFIFWKTREQLRTVRNIGDARLPDTPDGDFVQHVLDGQQRLTSLFASVRGLKVPRNGRIDDFANLYIDLDAADEQALVLTDVEGRSPQSVIRVVDLINGDFTFLGGFPTRYHGKLQAYKTRLESYSFSVVLVKEAPIDVATEIFTRINVTGKPLSVFEIMVAKTFDAVADFDLSAKFDEVSTKLANVDYETVRPETILQAVAIILKGECQTKDILGLDKRAFIAAWPNVVEALFAAVDYFRNYYRIPAARLLPFTPLLVPFTYFFSKHPHRPSGTAEQYLQDFFWRVALTGRYSASLESKLTQDIKRIDQILTGQLPEYDMAVDTSAGFIKANGYFRTSRSYARALLCLLAYQEPKSFDNRAIVRISNDWLKQANSKNYHHFFPRAFLRRSGFDDAAANHVGNITIVDDYLNKRVIGDKAPSVYLKRFAEINANLRDTLATHLIDLDSSGALSDDYERFLNSRCEAFSNELQKRIIPQIVDRRGQVAPEDEPVDESS